MNRFVPLKEKLINKNGKIRIYLKHGYTFSRKIPMETIEEVLIIPKNYEIKLRDYEIKRIP